MRTFHAGVRRCGQWTQIRPYWTDGTKAKNWTNREIYETLGILPLVHISLLETCQRLLRYQYYWRRHV